MYVVEERYEYWGVGGKGWTKWFRQAQCETEDEAKEKMKASKELCKSIDKSTKLKHEFNVRKLTDEEVKEIEDFWAAEREKQKKKAEKKESKTIKTTKGTKRGKRN